MCQNSNDRGDWNGLNASNITKPLWKTWSRTDDLVSLFGTTPEDFIFCTLHSLLRIVEDFILWTYTKIDETRKMTDFYKIMCEDLGVGFKVYQSATRGEVIKSYHGGQCMKILQNIEKITSLMDGPKKELTKNWTKFRRIFNDIQEGTLTGDGELGAGKEVKEEVWQKHTNLWAKEFMRIHGGTGMKIYPHLIACHSKDLIKKFGPMKFFCQQDFEAANSLHAQYAHHHSDHHFNDKKENEEISSGDMVIGRHYMVLDHSLEKSKKRKRKAPYLGCEENLEGSDIESEEEVQEKRVSTKTGYHLSHKGFLK
jgi:hypothetical protein